MRIRGTKPEFWRSRRIASVSWDARLVLKGLESYVDDNGVGKDDLALIVSDIFPRDMLANPRETLARVSDSLDRLSEAGLLHRYEVDGTGYLFVAFWESVQRIDKPGKGRMPRPDGTFDYGDSEIRESVAKPRESVAPGTGEQGNRGTGDQGTDIPAPPALVTEQHFDEVWAHWPKKTERKKSLAKFRQVARRRGGDALAADVVRFGDAYAATTDRQFVPALSVWLAGERWTDPLPEPHHDDRKARVEQITLPPADDETPAHEHLWQPDGTCRFQGCIERREVAS